MFDEGQLPGSYPPGIFLAQKTRTQSHCMVQIRDSGIYWVVIHVNTFGFDSLFEFQGWYW